MKSTLPERLHDPLHGSDRGLRALRRARRGVPEHRGADHAPEQDERLPAEGAGDDGRHDAGPGNAPPARPRRAQAVVLTSRAWGHEGGNDITAEFVNPGAAELAADGDGQRERHPRQPRDRRDGRAVEHGRAGRRRDQRQSGGERARRGAHVPRQRGRGHRRSRARRSTCPTSSSTGDERARPARAVRVLRACGSARSATAQQGRRLPLLPAARPRVGDAADVPRDRRAAAPELRASTRRRGSSSTTSTSSSCRRRTRTARTTRCTTSPSSGAT